MRLRVLIGIAFLLALAFTPISCHEAKMHVGSKMFTESVILGEVATLIAKDAGESCLHYRQLGGTKLVYDALCAGEIDIYPEYTGTITEEIFSKRQVSGIAEMRQLLSADGIQMTDPLGFNNTYAIGIKKELADERGIESITDLTRHPDLRLGFSNEFMDRSDGWPSLQQHYALPQQDVKGMDHELAYRQLDEGIVDAIDVYVTDAKIRYYDLVLLTDDRDFFPVYDAVYLFRTDLDQRAPNVVQGLSRISGQISESDMKEMNGLVELHREVENRVAQRFLAERLGVQVEIEEQTTAARIWQHTVEHIDLVRQSLIAAILVAIPLGVLATRRPQVGQVILGIVGIIQTIPSLALLVILIAPVNKLGLSSVGGGSTTAVIALFLYSLLPIVRNTHAGLTGIPVSMTESAAALGLSPSARLRLVELPLASPTILAGIKTAAVINVGFATLGALIGAGGYGQPVLTGIRLNDTGLILQGAIPAALMALAMQGLFELIERRFVSQGLRIKSE